MKKKIYKFWSRPIGGSEQTWTEWPASNGQTAKDVRKWAKENNVEITSKIHTYYVYQ